MDRVKLFKLAWDALGSEFGSRHLQYEMFYSGPSFVTRGHAYRNYDWQNIRSLLDGFMATYDVDGLVADTIKDMQASAAQ
jgi:4-hydroxyphenylacetate 3-monooxygenase